MSTKPIMPDAYRLADDGLAQSLERAHQALRDLASWCESEAKDYASLYVDESDVRRAMYYDGARDGHTEAAERARALLIGLGVKP